ncbi:MAG: hypothetical protein ACM3QW_10145 [Ignavibacteriales bacterium]
MKEIKWQLLKQRIRKVKVWAPLLCLIGTALIQSGVITIDQSVWDNAVSNVLLVAGGLGILANPDE